MSTDLLNQRDAIKRMRLIEHVLETRKARKGIEYYTPNKTQYKAHQSKAEMILYCGGNRCLGGETKIRNPITGKLSRVDEITSPFLVSSWNGEKSVLAIANTPFVKGYGKLYRITLSNGKQLVASGGHRILTHGGFLSVSELQEGLSVCVPQEYESSHRNFLEVFQSFRNLCVALRELNLESNHNLCNNKESLVYQKVSTLYSQNYTTFDALQSCSFDHPQTISDISLSTLLGDVLRYFGKEQDSLFYYQNVHHLYDGQSHVMQENDPNVFPLPTDARERIFLNYMMGDLDYKLKHNQSYLSNDRLSNQHVQNHFCTPDDILPSKVTSKIKSIEFVREDFFYDFTVPLYHNYQDVSTMVSANSGKSTFGAAELAWHLTRKYPDFFPKERKFYKPIKAVVVATENPIIDKVIWPKISSFLPTDYIKDVRKISGGYVSKILCKDGSQVDFLTNEQDDMAFESQDWDFYWGDEPQRQRKYQAIMRGLVDRHGIGVITFTPLVEPWMKEELVDKADGKRIETFISDIRDNLFDIKGNPILSESSIKRFEEDLPEDVRDTRIHGMFFHLRGAVYTEFSEIHTINFSYQYPDPVICVMDPHDRQPHHVIWAAIDRDDDIYVINELSKRCTVEELATSIRAVEKMNGYKMRRRLIDPNFGRKPLIITGRNMIEEMAKAGCPGWGEADDAKEEGRLKVKEYLHYDRSKPVSFTNKPKLFFHKEKTPLTIRSMRNHQYEEWVGKIAGERDPKEKPKDKETHGADCVRYLCMSNPRWSGAKQEETVEAFY